MKTITLLCASALASLALTRPSRPTIPWTAPTSPATDAAPMTDYRRYHFPGHTYFFTVNLADRRQRLLTDHIDDLPSAFREVMHAHPFTIHAIVILPEHLHCLLELPPGDSDYSTRWRQIKSAFSRILPKAEAVSASRARRNERGIWQRRFWGHTARDEAGFAARFDDIHFASLYPSYGVCV